MTKTTDQTTTETTTGTTTETTTSAEMSSSFREKFSGKSSGTTSATTPGTTTTTTGTTETTTATTEGTTTDQTTTSAKKRRRAAGYENVPEALEEIKKTAEAVADIARELKSPAKPAEPADTFVYSDVEKKQLAVLEEMETLFPDKYSGKTSAVKKFIQTIEAHIDDFKKKNPDAKEEEVADAAAEYREKLGVNWDEEDFAEARISLRTRPILEENKRLKEKVEGVVDGETHRAQQPAIAKNAAAATATVANSIGEAYKGLVAPDGSIVQAKADELIADDQLVGETVVAAIEQTNQTAVAIQLAFGGKASVAKLSQHQRGAAGFWAMEAERLISELEDPKDRRDDEGRMFAPRAKYKEMDAKEREKHWVIGAAEVIPIMVNGIAEAAKADLAKIAERDAKRGIVHKREETTTEGTTTDTTTKAGKPDSPTSTDPKNLNNPEPVAQGFWDRLRNGTVKRPTM